MDAGFNRKEDVSLPKATMTKIIKEMLPKDVRVARDAQDLLMECCLEFIHLISSESNEICSKEDKKTISPEHVLDALKTLGFDAYVGDVVAAYDQHRAETLESPRAGARDKKKAPGMSEEEATAAQLKMFAEAKARMNSTLTIPTSNPSTDATDT